MKLFGTHISHDAQETAVIGAELAAWIQKQGNTSPVVICLYGELGSGKTTFVQAVAKACGIPGRLLSPTFTIVRRYNIPKTEGFFYHIDVYRLSNQKEAVEVGVNEMINEPQSITCIEWAEKITPLLPEKRIDITFSVDESGNHHITLHNRYE